MLYSTLSLVRHNNFQSGAFDLGLYDQAVWQYSNFIYPYNTVKERFILGDHLTLNLPLLSPLFYIWNDVRILLIFQSIWISFSTLAIYKIARLRQLSPLISFNLSFIYSLFYGIQFGVFFDFHPVIIGVGILAWLAYFLESKRKKLLIISIILLLLTQENMGIALASLGLIYVFRKDYRKIAIFLVILGLSVSFASSKIVSSFSPVGFQYAPEISLNPVKIIFDLFNSEEKRQVWFYSYSWFSFLPLLSPGSILAVLLDLSQYFTTGLEFKRMWSPFMHHRAILSVFLILGMLDAFYILNKKKINIKILSVILVFVALTFQFLFHFPLNKLSKANFWQQQSWMKDSKEILQFVPKNASVASQQNLVPHLSHRREIYLIWPRMLDLNNSVCKGKSCWWLEFGGKPQYLVVNLHQDQWITQLLETPINFKTAVSNMQKAGKITKVKNINSAYLYKINN